MQVKDTQPGDVLRDSDGKVWMRTGREPWEWNTFSGMVSFYGPWLPGYGPQGELTLLVRDRKAVNEP